MCAATSGLVVPLLPFGMPKYDAGERFDLRSPYADDGWVVSRVWGGWGGGAQCCAGWAHSSLLIARVLKDDAGGRFDLRSPYADDVIVVRREYRVGGCTDQRERRTCRGSTRHCRSPFMFSSGPRHVAYAMNVLLLHGLHMRLLIVQMLLHDTVCVCSCDEALLLSVLRRTLRRQMPGQASRRLERSCSTLEASSSKRCATPAVLLVCVCAVAGTVTTVLATAGCGASF